MKNLTLMILIFSSLMSSAFAFEKCTASVWAENKAMKNKLAEFVESKGYKVVSFGQGPEIDISAEWPECHWPLGCGLPKYEIYLSTRPQNDDFITITKTWKAGTKKKAFEAMAAELQLEECKAE